MDHHRRTDFPALRVARPTNDIAALLPFYCGGLGLEVLDRFEAHAGYDGIMLGHPASPWHLELTHRRGHVVGRAPTREHLLVWYRPDRDDWSRAVARMRAAGFASVTPENPYWARCGATFEDPDGYCIVLQQAAWEPAGTTSSSLR